MHIYKFKAQSCSASFLNGLPTFPGAHNSQSWRPGCLPAASHFSSEARAFFRINRFLGLQAVWAPWWLGTEPVFSGIGGCMVRIQRQGNLGHDKELNLRMTRRGWLVLVRTRWPRVGGSKVCRISPLPRMFLLMRLSSQRDCQAVYPCCLYLSYALLLLRVCGGNALKSAQ